MSGMLGKLMLGASMAAIMLADMATYALADSYRLGSVLPSGSPAMVAAKMFADEVRERTGGEVNISVFPDAQLGNDVDLGRDLSRGALDFSFIQQGSLTGLNPLLEFGHLPYLVTNEAQADKVIYNDGIIHKTIAETFAQYGVRLLAFYELESRSITNSTRPITSVEDLKGLRIRVPSSRTLRNFIDAVGAQPITVPFGELFGALQQGLVDGQENGPILTYTSRISEAQKYMTVLNYQYSFGSMVVSDATWNKLSAEHQKIVQEVANEVSLKERKLAKEAGKDAIEKIKASGVAVIEYDQVDPVQLKRFQEIGRQTWSLQNDSYGAERIEALRSEIAAAER